MELGAQLFQCLRQAGVDCTFGVPGDFVTPLYAAQLESNFRTVVCAHEPGAAFAADAYARLRGLGVVLGTYGAGALNMVNAVAMSYAEHTPLLVISGAPDTERRGPEVYVHHLVKCYKSQLRVFREITVAAEAPETPEAALRAAIRLIREVKAQRRPGYLEIPRNLVRQSVAHLDPAPEAPPPADAGIDEVLREAVNEIGARLRSARRPVLYAGVGVRRFGLTSAAIRLAERFGLPVVSSVMGKASIPESHPQFSGVYMGALGDPIARKHLEESDCVLTLGVIPSDVNSGLGTGRLDPRNQILVDENSTWIRYHRYEPLPMNDLVNALAVGTQVRTDPVKIRTPIASKPCPDHKTLRTDQLIASLQSLDPAKYSFVADVGDAWFVGLELRADVFLAPGYYATMGYGVPGAIGAELADPSRRPFVLVGDGAFRMTGTELGTLVDLKLPAIVLVLNNSSYLMLECLDGSRPYYELRDWDYVAFARAMGCPGERVVMWRDLQAALGRAEAAQGPYLIEAVLDKEDPSPVMRRMKAHVSAMRAERKASAGSREEG